MKYVLMVLIAMQGGGGFNTWQQPAMMSATFDDKNACDAAGAVMHAWARDRGADIREVRVACVPQASWPERTEKAAPPAPPAEAAKQ